MTAGAFVIVLFLATFSVVRCGGDVEICLDRVVSGSNLIDVRVAPGTSDLFVAQKEGILLRLNRTGTTRLVTVADFRTGVAPNGEQGFLSFAFHPKFTSDPNKRLIYVYYIRRSDGTSVVSERAMNATGGLQAERVLFTVAQPFSNHNGGSLLFSPLDGYLYVTFGDGGSHDDTAQRWPDQADVPRQECCASTSTGATPASSTRCRRTTRTSATARFCPRSLQWVCAIRFAASFIRTSRAISTSPTSGRARGRRLKIIDTVRRHRLARASTWAGRSSRARNCNTNAYSEVPSLRGSVTAARCNNERSRYEWT
jgi:hypothetical protein